MDLAAGIVAVEPFRHEVTASALMVETAFGHRDAGCARHECVEGAAERHQRARVLRDVGVPGVVDDGPGVAATCRAIIDLAAPGGPQTMVGWRASTRMASTSASSLGRSV